MQTVPAAVRCHCTPIREAELKRTVLFVGACSQSSLLRLLSAFLESKVAIDIQPGTSSPKYLSHGNKSKHRRLFITTLLVAATNWKQTDAH